MKAEQYHVDQFEEFSTEEPVPRESSRGSLTSPASELEPSPESAYFDLKRRFSGLVIQVDRLRARLLGIDTRYKPSLEKWSINEHLGHLIDVDRDIWGPRIHTMIQIRNAYFENIDQDQLVKDHRWQDASLAELTAQLMRARWNNAILINALPEEAFVATAKHFDRGVITLQNIIEIMVDHDAHHLERIRELIQESERQV
jgi:hypothetical protein